MKPALLVAAFLTAGWLSLVVGAGPLHESESFWAELLGWTTAVCFFAAVAVIVVVPLRALARRRRSETNV